MIVVSNQIYQILETSFDLVIFSIEYERNFERLKTALKTRAITLSVTTFTFEHKIDEIFDKMYLTIFVENDFQISNIEM